MERKHPTYTYKLFKCVLHYILLSVDFNSIKAIIYIESEWVVSLPEISMSVALT